MRRLQSLLSRHSPSPRPVAVQRRAAAQETPATDKPPAKRCLNEGGHKLYR